MTIKYLNEKETRKIRNVKKLIFIEKEEGTKIKVILYNSFIIPIIDVKNVITIKNKQYEKNKSKKN